MIVYNNHPEHLGEELATSKTATQTAPIPAVFHFTKIEQCVHSPKASHFHSKKNNLKFYVPARLARETIPLELEGKGEAVNISRAQSQEEPGSGEEVTTMAEQFYMRSDHSSPSRAIRAKSRGLWPHPLFLACR